MSVRASATVSRPRYGSGRGSAVHRAVSTAVTGQWQPEAVMDLGLRLYRSRYRMMGRKRRAWPGASVSRCTLSLRPSLKCAHSGQLVVRLQSVNNRTQTLHVQPAPPNAGTKHLIFNPARPMEVDHPVPRTLPKNRPSLRGHKPISVGRKGLVIDGSAHPGEGASC